MVASAAKKSRKKRAKNDEAGLEMTGNIYFYETFKGRKKRTKLPNEWALNTLLDSIVGILDDFLRSQPKAR